MKPRILITRAPHQASPLADALRARGYDPILIPTIEFAPPTTFAALDAALASLHTFDWLLFTSANAVEAFAARIAIHLDPKYPDAPNLDLETWVGLPPHLRIAAIGSATARALTPLGLQPDLLPPQAVAESRAAALLPHALAPDGSPTRFLLVRAQLLRDNSTRDPIPHTLRAAGARLTIAPAYRTLIPSDSIPAIRRLFATPATWPATITFTSSSTATNLLTLLAAAGLQLPPKILRISIGPITSQTLRDLGHPPHAEAALAGIPSMVEAVVKALATLRTL